MRVLRLSASTRAVPWIRRPAVAASGITGGWCHWLRSGSDSRPATLSCETITAGTWCLRAHGPVQRSVVRSETSSRSGRSDSRMARTRRLDSSSR